MANDTTYIILPFVSGFWFSVLLNLKHIYLYCAPVYFFYLLKHYCIHTNGSHFDFVRSFTRLAKLGTVVIAVFAASFGPFAYYNQLSSVLARLFPFKRGLCHAYWAPNFWALYNVADKLALVAATRFDLIPKSQLPVASMTGGLVQEFDHSVLPSVPPLATFVASFASMVPCLIKLWAGPKDPVQFVRVLGLCSFGSYMFGWHVHEKAILLVIIPFTVLAFLDRRDADLLLFVSATGHTSLLPLLFRHQEFAIKVCLVLFHAVLVARWHANFYGPASSRPSPKARRERSVWKTLQSIYLCGLVALPAVEVAAPLLPQLKGYPFLTLLAYSIYCAIGLVYAWLRIYVRCLTA